MWVATSRYSPDSEVSLPPAASNRLLNQKALKQRCKPNRFHMSPSLPRRKSRLHPPHRILSLRCCIRQSMSEIRGWEGETPQAAGQNSSHLCPPARGGGDSSASHRMAGGGTPVSLPWLPRFLRSSRSHHHPHDAFRAFLWFQMGVGGISYLFPRQTS